MCAKVHVFERVMGSGMSPKKQDVKCHVKLSVNIEDFDKVEKFTKVLVA